MEGAVKAAALVDELLPAGQSPSVRSGPRLRSPAMIRREYVRFIDDSAAPFVRLVNLFYDHSFRELFLHGRGPFQVQRATISVLGGYVFPKPAWSLRWRIWLLHRFANLQRYVPIVRRRDRFSLRRTAPVRVRPVEAALASA